MKKYGLVGKSLKHSFSASFFEKKFKEENIQATYENFELDDISQIQSVFDRGVSGLNVTIPYKVSVIPFLDELSEEAKEIGAVNTIVFKNGKSVGHNTDAYGFRNSIKPFLTNLHEKALILGTGGASLAVAHVFRSIGIEVLYLSRNPRNPNEFSYSEANGFMLEACKCIVNTTPVGQFPSIDEFPPIPYSYLTLDHLVIDLIYNPSPTEFLKKSAQSGATVLNGLAMLEHQALKAWEIWSLRGEG